MSTATVDPETGEVLSVVKYDPSAYLASLTKHDGLAVQAKLAAAYDAACLELIGPNDVQVEGKRSFKKKSAWRKLARYFGISVEIVRVDNTKANGHFLSTVTARAVAPWGQRYEEVGACCTDEATGMRVITVADAIATASTRASNRAVSNLIAMGEVSAEEIGDRRPTDAPRANGNGNGNGKASVMPFGKTKGTPLAKLAKQEIESALAWAESKNKFEDFQTQARKELDRRADNEYAERDANASELTDMSDAGDLPF